MEHNIDIKVEEPWSDKDGITHSDMQQTENVDTKIKPEPFQYAWFRDVKDELVTQTKDETATVKTEKGNAEESQCPSVVKDIDTNLPTLKSECQAASQVHIESILPPSVFIDLKSEKHLTIPNASSNKDSSGMLISSDAFNDLNNGGCLLKRIDSPIIVHKRETNICTSNYESDSKGVETVAACNHSPCETSDKLNCLEHKTVQSKLALKSNNKNECNICGKAFQRSSKLISHIRCHTGERPYKCTVCDKTFSRKDVMLTHTTIHTGLKPFKCSVCDKAFTQKGDMVKHSRTHTGSKPFKCTVCDKAFTQKITMLNHTRIHTGSKPFKCTVCDKAFNRKSNMLTHTKTHTG